jgi:hypothetical protein
LQFNLFSINVDHTSSKLHACQWRPRGRMWVTWPPDMLSGRLKLFLSVLQLFLCLYSVH